MFYAPDHRHFGHRAGRHTPTVCDRCARREYELWVRFAQEGHADPLGEAERVARLEMSNVTVYA